MIRKEYKKILILAIFAVVAAMCAIMSFGANIYSVSAAGEISANGAGVMITGDQSENGIRFNIIIEKGYYDSELTEGGVIKADVETGVIVVPEHLLSGSELTLDEVKTADNGKYAVKKVINGLWKDAGILAQGDNGIYYPADSGSEYMENYVYLYNLPENAYDTDIAFRGYINIAGEVSYTEMLVRSMSEVALAAINDDPELADDLDKYLYNYEVTFEDGEGTPAQQVKYGEKAILPTQPEKKGYNFIGWYEDSSLSIEFDFENNIIKKDTIIYAKWEDSFDEADPLTWFIYDDTHTVTKFNDYGITFTADTPVSAGGWGQIGISLKGTAIEHFRTAGVETIALYINSKEGQNTSIVTYKGTSVSENTLLNGYGGGSFELDLADLAVGENYDIYVSYRGDGNTTDGIIVGVKEVSVFNAEDKTTYYRTADLVSEVEAADGGAKIGNILLQNMQVIVFKFYIRSDVFEYMATQGFGGVTLRTNGYSDGAIRVGVWTGYLAAPANQIIPESFGGSANLKNTDADDSGVLLTVWYRAEGGVAAKYVNYQIDGYIPLDENDLGTYYDSAAAYTAEEDYVKFEMPGTGNLQFGVTLRPEAVKYFTDEGFGKVVFSIVSPDGKSVEVYENAWGRYQNFYNAASKGTVSFNLADYTGKGITLHFVVYNCTDAARVNLHVRGDKAFDVNDYATYVDELGGSGISGTFTVIDNNPDGYQLQFNGEEATAVGAYVNNNFEYFTLSQDMLDYFKGEGYSKIRVTVSSKDGQGSIFGMWIGANMTAIAPDPATTFMVMTFEIDLEQGFYMPNGNWNKENRGFRMAVIYDKRGVVNSDGFMIKIEPVSADNTVS